MEKSKVNKNLETNDFSSSKKERRFIRSITDSSTLNANLLGKSWQSFRDNNYIFSEEPVNKENEPFIRIILTSKFQEVIDDSASIILNKDLDENFSNFDDLLEPNYLKTGFGVTSMSTIDEFPVSKSDEDFTSIWRGIFTPPLKKEEILKRNIKFEIEQIPKLKLSIKLDKRTLRRIEEDE